MTAATAAQAAEAEHNRTAQAATDAHLTHVGFADIIADLEARYVDGDPSVTITSIEKAKRDAERARLESARAAAENDKAAQRAAEAHTALAEEQRAALEARITDPDDELNRLLAELPALVARARDLIDERHAACVALRAAPRARRPVGGLRVGTDRGPLPRRDLHPRRRRGVAVSEARRGHHGGTQGVIPPALLAELNQAVHDAPTPAGAIAAKVHRAETIKRWARGTQSTPTAPAESLAPHWAETAVASLNQAIGDRRQAEVDTAQAETARQEREAVVTQARTAYSAACARSDRSETIRLRHLFPEI